MARSKFGNLLRFACVALPAAMIGCGPPPPAKSQGGSGGTQATPAATSAPTVTPTSTAATPTAAPTSAPTPHAVFVGRGDWHVLEPDNEGFRIELPAAPDVQAGELDTPDGKTFMRLYSLADDGRKRVYSVAANRLAKKVDAAGIDGHFERARDGAVKLVGGRVVRETKIEHDGFPARRLVFELPGGLYLHGRMITADDRFYQVNILSDSEELTADDRRVFESLRIGAAKSTALRPQLAWRFVTPQGSTFAVEMPGDPREQVGLLNTPLGKVSLRRLEVQASARVFFAQSCDLPMTAAMPTAARLDAARDHILQETGGKPAAESDVTLLDSEGRALAVKVGERTMWVRTFIDGPRIYQIGVVGAGEPTDDDRRFFDSLRLSERPQPK